MAPSKTRKRKSDQGSVSTSEPAANTTTMENSKRQKHLPVRSKDGDSSAADSSSPVKGSAKGTMVTFDDDDEAQPPVLPSASTQKPYEKATVEEEEEDSDDDAAPEAVSTQQTASKVNKLTQAAQKVAQEQAATQKRKRQERDALFKQQAVERKKTEEEAQANATTESAQKSGPTSGRRRVDKVHVPDVLPAEFLTDSSSEDEDEELGVSEARSKKRKITSIDKKLSRQDRAPRDARVGSTVYRVAKKTDERMTPKATKYGKSTKDLLLQRNRSAAKPRSGFFTRK